MPSHARHVSRTASLALAAALAATPALAEYCAPEVSEAQERVRQEHVTGMTGVATQNYSSRPGTMADMACLEGLMQGKMDLLFRPPDLQSLLQEVISFACERIEEEIAGALGGVGDLADFGSLTGGGLQIPSIGGGGGSVVNASAFGSIFGEAGR